MKPRSRRWIYLGVVAAVLVICAIILMRQPSLPALPNPNGYDDLVVAAQIVR